MIRVADLSKRYGKRLAVDGISFEIQEGEIVGFLGPNGAGKSTTMRMITGYLMPTHGDVWVADHNMATDSLGGRRQIGYLPEIVPLYLDMTTRQYLEFVGRLRGLQKKDARSRTEGVLETCSLREYSDVILGRLSKGFRQRVGLAQAIIHDPKVLILDEPTIGIDPIQMTQTRKLIRELGKGRTILLSTHVLPEVSMMCERVIIIHEGRIVAQDSIQKLAGVLRAVSGIRVKVHGPAEEVAERLASIGGIQRVSYDAPYHTVEYPSGQEPEATIVETVVRAGWTLLSMESVDMSLEDIFLQLTAEREGRT